MLSAYLLAVSVYTNAVRPAAALSLNLSDFVAARWEDNYMIMRCVHHKTSSTHGPAKILLKEPQSGLLQGYVQVVRPTLPCISQQPLLLVNNRGEAIKNYQHYLHKLTEAYNLPQLPTPTAARCAISTTVASHGTSADLHPVSKQFGHLTSISEKYYQAARLMRDMTSLMFCGARVPLLLFLFVHFFCCTRVSCLLLCNQIDVDGQSLRTRVLLYLCSD